jgi:hypothetical protein
VAKIIICWLLNIRLIFRNLITSAAIKFRQKSSYLHPSEDLVLGLCTHVVCVACYGLPEQEMKEITIGKKIDLPGLK